MSMKKYVELTLIPDSETELYFLWGKLYQQLHLAFVEIKDNQNKVAVGVSFPQYHQEKRQLGNKLRVFADSEQELENLQLTKWLERLSDYAHLKKIQNVPEKIDGYAFFSRLIEKGNDEKLARRRAKKLNVSYEEALEFFKDKQNRLQPRRDAHLYPFISMQSLSSENRDRHPVTVVRSEAQGLVFGKGFSTYGLSSDSSVPLF